MVLTAGTPIATAAISSSRSATQARPIRESRRRKFTNSTTTTRNKANQYHGFMSKTVNGSRNGRSIRSTGEMPWRPAVIGVPPRIVDAVAG